MRKQCEHSGFLLRVIARDANNGNSVLLRCLSKHGRGGRDGAQETENDAPITKLSAVTVQHIDSRPKPVAVLGSVLDKEGGSSHDKMRRCAHTTQEIVAVASTDIARDEKKQVGKVFLVD